MRIYRSFGNVPKGFLLKLYYIEFSILGINNQTITKLYNSNLHLDFKLCNFAKDFLNHKSTFNNLKLKKICIQKKW
jgi:hypothetical protein